MLIISQVKKNKVTVKNYTGSAGGENTKSKSKELPNMSEQATAMLNEKYKK